MGKSYLRGDIYYADLQKGVGSEQEGVRPVVIIQNDIGNRFSPTVIVAAVSSKESAKATLPTHHFIGTEAGLKQPSTILLEQIRTIDKRRLTNYIGHLSQEHIEGMNRALAISTDLVQSVSRPLILCLCHVCADNFRASGNNVLRRIDPYQVKRDTCTYCNRRLGYDYEVIPKANQRAE